MLADSVRKYSLEHNGNVTLGHNYLETGVGHNRSKRALWNLYFVLNCGSDCGAFSYNNYGCFCGWGGSGTPMDGIDSCCKQHDDCYNRVSCPLSKAWDYSWSCYRGNAVCDYDRSIPFEDLSWGQQLCKCDQDFAMCVKKYDCVKTKKECQRLGYKDEEEGRNAFVPKPVKQGTTCEMYQYHWHLHQHRSDTPDEYGHYHYWYHYVLAHNHYKK